MLVADAGVSLSLIAQAPNQDWPQWGGPTRDFKVNSGKLAERWPTSGPPKVWERPLGLGHSAIVAEGGRLYTMYRRGEREFLIAMDAATGRMLWEFAYDAPYPPKMEMQYGDGPHATPLITGDVVCGTGTLAQLHCVDKRNGRLRWKCDLWQEYGARRIGVGYSSSPVAWRDLVIAQVGEPGPGLIAFRREDGSEAWRSPVLRNSSSTPIFIRLGGREQLIAYMHHEVVGLDLESGALLWKHPITAAGQQWNFHFNISTPVWSSDGLLFVSSAYGIGGRVLQLRAAGDRTEVRQLWQEEPARVHKENAMRIGDTIYASTGHLGPAFFTAIDARSGRVLWKDRRFSHASFLYADGKFLILDEDGKLGLAIPGAAGFNLLAESDVLRGRSWTVPTLVGTRLYLRDRYRIVALELGAAD